MVSQEKEIMAKTPLWKRLTAFFTLGSITILTGITFAAILSILGLLVLFEIEGG